MTDILPFKTYSVQSKKNIYIEAKKMINLNQSKDKPILMDRL